jgi:hypothetical protein
MKTKTLKLLAAISIFAVAEIAGGQNSQSKAEANVACPFIQAAPLTPYGFAGANLVSLWYARNSVRDALAEMKQDHNETSAFSTLTAMMRSTKVSTNNFLCAKKSVERYASAKTHLTDATASQQESVQTAAEFAVMVYDQHIDINRRMLDLLKKMPTNSSPAQLSDEISTLQVERGQRWADLVTPTALALMVLVDTRPTDDDGNFIQTTDPNVGHTKRLVITKKQKQELLDWSNEHFTEFQDGTPQDQWSDPAKTAKLLYTKLFDGRKCSDE